MYPFMNAVCFIADSLDIKLSNSDGDVFRNFVENNSKIINVHYFILPRKYMRFISL